MFTIARKDEAEFTDEDSGEVVGPDLRGNQPYYGASERWHVIHMAFRVDSSRITADSRAVQQILSDSPNFMSGFLGSPVHLRSYDFRTVPWSPGGLGFSPDSYRTVYQFTGLTRNDRFNTPYLDISSMDRMSLGCVSTCWLFDELASPSGPHRCQNDCHCNGMRTCNSYQQCVGSTGRCARLSPEGESGPDSISNASNLSSTGEASADTETAESSTSKAAASSSSSAASAATTSVVETTLSRRKADELAPTQAAVRTAGERGAEAQGQLEQPPSETLRHDGSGILIGLSVAIMVAFLLAFTVTMCFMQCKQVAEEPSKLQGWKNWLWPPRFPKTHCREDIVACFRTFWRRRSSKTKVVAANPQARFVRPSLEKRASFSHSASDRSPASSTTASSCRRSATWAEPARRDSKSRCDPDGSPNTGDSKSPHSAKTPMSKAHSEPSFSPLRSAGTPKSQDSQTPGAAKDAGLDLSGTFGSSLFSNGSSKSNTLDSRVISPVGLAAELTRMKRQKSLSERKAFYKEQCLRWHPDKNAGREQLATSMFVVLQEKKAWFLSGDD
eukprot:TRINITY_DN30947_c0_g1_i1.p1 TRINITY_DN30947_c0_g1~~TRINITY_DN30947_c0_g1_i1.p1  ORF type:complete len:557 (+),score=59.23 TRINITY_DN30947_c0_g1_i1:249-1919(+)